MLSSEAKRLPGVLESCRERFEKLSRSSLRIGRQTRMPGKPKSKKNVNVNIMYYLDIVRLVRL